MVTRPQPAQLSPQALETLSTLGDDSLRRAFLEKNTLMRPECVVELNAATQKEFRIDTQKALCLAESAILVARAVDRPDLLAQSFRMKANVQVAAGNYGPAISLYNRALTSFEKLRDLEGTARTLLAVIQPRIMLGNYGRAFSAARRAKRLLIALKDRRRLARLENNIGNIYHRQDRFKQALAHYELAHRRLLPHGDSEELTIALNNMSMCLIGLNDFSGALRAHRQAKRLLGRRPFPLIRLITDYNIAYLHYLRGDYRQAIAMLRDAEHGAKRIGYGYLVALCQLDLSDIYVELNLSNDAREVAHEAFQSFSNLAITYEAAKARTNEAIALGQLGETESSLILFAEARGLFVQESNPVWPWIIDLYQAVMLTERKKYVAAQDLLLPASRHFHGKSLRGKAVLCQLVFAQAAMGLNQPIEAAARTRKAIKLLKTFDSPILDFAATFLRAEIARSRNQPRAAYQAYQRARRPLESLRGSLARDELKIAFMKDKAKLYERLVELCLAETGSQCSKPEAFDYIELAKSRSLAESLSQRSNQLAEPGNTRSKRNAAQHQLHDQLTWYQHRMESEQLKPSRHSDRRIDNLRHRVRTIERQLLREIRDARENKTRTTAGFPGALSRSQIMSSLHQDETLVEYFITDEQIVAAIVTKASIDILPVTTLPKITGSLRLLRFQLGRAQLREGRNFAREDDHQAVLEHLHVLYAQLIEPLGRHLSGSHLTIVPHGILHQLPFHALHDGHHYLIDQLTIAYAPSASIYALCKAPPSHKAHGALIMGCPDERAPQIRTEVRLVQRLLPDSELALGQRASRKMFFQVASTKRLIHIASHATFRPDNPMFSGFKLSDGYVYLYELCRLRLSADLLTLSGCSTGLNAVAAGDELVGLIRGALIAGARSVLLSLWDVSDTTTAHFMTTFYRKLSEGNNRALAFAQAAKDLRAAYPHPYHWAPFILVGKVL